jgi:GT2 family glycosyltransferase
MIKKHVSIIIPSWFCPGQNGRYGDNETFWFANECLKRLVSVTSRQDSEIIIIDNGSDMSNINEEEAKNYWNTADILIKNKFNLGFGPACNQGFKLATGKFIVCMNNDILVFKGWLNALLEPLTMNIEPLAGISVPALVKNTRNAEDAIKMANPDLRANYNIFTPGVKFGSMWASTRAVLEIIREAVIDNKYPDGYYFDENFLLGFGENDDLWDRIKLAGYETYRTHRLRVFHQGNMSFGKVENKYQYTKPNQEYLEAKRGARKNKTTPPDRNKF